MIGRRFVRDAGVLGAANGFVSVIAIVQGLLIARWLGAELYGVFALTIGYPALVHAVLHARAGEATVKYLGEFIERGDTSRARALTLLSNVVDFAAGAATLVIVAGTAWWAEGRIIHTEGMAISAILYAGALVPRSLYGSSHAILSTLGRFSLLAGVDMLAAIIRAGIVLGLVAGGFGVQGAIIGSATGIAFHGMLAVLVSYPVATKALGGSWFAARLGALQGRRREIFSFIFFLDLGGLLGVFSKQADVLFVGSLTGAADAGLYRLAKVVAGGGGYLVGPLQSVAYPRFAQLAAQDVHALSRFAERLAFTVGLPLGILALSSVLWIGEVLPNIVGPSYDAALPAVRLLLAGTAAWLLFFWLRPLYLARGYIRFWTANGAVMIALLVAGFAVVGPLWGFVGMAAWLATIQIVGHVIPAVRWWWIKTGASR